MSRLQLTYASIDYHIIWSKCCPHWDDLQWPWPRSIPQGSRSLKTFEGQSTHACVRAITYLCIEDWVGIWPSFGCLVNWHEKETQQTYFPSILFLEQISMLYSYTWMLHCIPYTHHQFFCIQYIISGHLNSAAQNARAIFSRGESIQNIMCIHCLIYLLYKRYTQHEFNSLINMPRLNLAERNRLWGFSLWCFTDCGSWTIQCFKINNFEVSWTC